MSNGESIQSIDVTGSSVEEAIEDGLEQLGLSRSEVIIEIIEEGGRGMLGMGNRETLVRLTPLRTPRPKQPQFSVKSEGSSQPAEIQLDEDEADEIADEVPEPEAFLPVDAVEVDDVQLATETLVDLLQLMEIPSELHVYRAEATDDPEEYVPWVIDIRGEDLGVLIGRKGETLDALQVLTRLIISRDLERRANIVLDVEGYKLRREGALRKLAQRMAEQARRIGRTVKLEPMPPNERRIIHITLRNDDTVNTESVGSGDKRHVTIIPNT